MRNFLQAILSFSKNPKFLLIPLFVVTVNVNAGSEYCNYTVNNNGNDEQQIGMTWTTLDNGDVQITIAPKKGNTSVEFRNGGIEGDFSNIKVSTDNFATETSATSYFERAANPNGTTTYTLHRTGNNAIPAGLQIRTNNAIAWQGTPTTGDMWNSSQFTYTYGTVCGSDLAAPANISISDGVITFDAVEGATSYKAYIYQGSTYFTSIDVTSGGLMTYILYLAGTYQVRLRAFNGTQFSDFSAPYDWVIESDNTSGNLPPSSVNKRSITNGNNATEVYVSLETDLVTGNILGIISPVNAADDDYVYWREDGIRFESDNFTYKEGSSEARKLTDYFNLQYYTDHRIQNEDVSKIDTIYLYPKNEGDYFPTYGGVIAIANNSTATVVWHYNNAGTYSEGISFPDYVYGSGSGTLSRPIISSVTEAGVISFAAVPEATSYKAYVYNSALEQVYEQDITNGGTINYHPYATDTYKVYLKAFGEDNAYSAVSAPVDWALEGNVAYLPQSAYCSTDVSGYANGKPVAFTWETVEGNIVITLSAASEPDAIEDGWHEDIQFRGGGMAVTNFKINGVSATDATFTKTVSGATLTLTPASNAVQAGDNITFEGTVEYQVAKKNDNSANTNDYPTLRFSYIYGTVCGENDHTNPVISAFTASPASVNSVTFHVEASDKTDSGSDGTIASYSLSGDNGFVTTAVSPDGEGNFTVGGLTYNKTYTFTLTVTDDRGNSVTSDGVEVVLPFNTELNLALGRGDYCTASAVQNDNPALVASKAVDGNAETFWTCFGTGEGEEGIWWKVDLGYIYDVNRVVITFNDIAAPYNIYASTDGTNWFTVVAGETASSQGTKTHSGLVIAARYFKVTSTNNSFGIKEFEVYGTAFSVADEVVPTVEVTCPEKTINSATLQIVASDVDDAGNAGNIGSISISGDNGFVTQENVTLDGSNQITLTGLTYNTTYTFTVTVLDRHRNQTVQNITVQLPLYTNFNLAEGKNAVAGKTQGDYTANLGCDGNESTMWSSYTEGDHSLDYWCVDLGAKYTIRQIKIKWMNEYSEHFYIQGTNSLSSFDAEGIAAASWTTYLDYTYASDPGTTQQTHDVVGKMRYLLLRSIKNENDMAGIEFYELEVYGSDYAEEDNVAPVIGTASCETDTEGATATLTLTATDAIDGEIKDFYISCATYGIAETKYTTDGSNQITITGLETHHDYTFHVRCRDLSGNWAETDVVAHFSISGGTNVALHKTTTSGRDEDGHAKGNAVDGNVDTYWGNYYIGEFEESMNWWQVDLGNAYKLNRIRIDWAENGCPNDENGGYIISASLNGADYTTLVEGAKYEGVGANENHYIREYNITGDAANTLFRYVRIQSKNPRFMSFNEFEVYATDEVPLLSLDETLTTNAATIATYAGQTCMVTLNRSFVADGANYTIVLPFDVDADMVSNVLKAGSLMKLQGARMKENGDMYLNMVDASSIEAGVAYLYMPNVNVSNPVFTNVRIKNDLQEESYGTGFTAQFKGIYDAVSVSGLETNSYFLGADDWLFPKNQITGNATMYAFRGYFVLNFPQQVQGIAPRARIVYNSSEVDTVTEINEVATPDELQKRIVNGQLIILRNGHEYNAQGQRMK